MHHDSVGVDNGKKPYFELAVWESNREWVKCLGPCHLSGKPGKISWLLNLRLGPALAVRSTCAVDQQDEDLLLSLTFKQMFKFLGKLIFIFANFNLPLVKQQIVFGLRQYSRC